MPNKHNTKGRHHIPKMKFTVRNWHEYDAALRSHGGLKMWVTSESIDCWAAVARTTRGGQSQYSDLAIETSLMLRLVFRQPLRQHCVLPAQPAHILIDNTGLKVFGAGEWLQEEHGKKSRRSWRKLHSRAHNSRQIPPRATRTCS